MAAGFRLHIRPDIAASRRALLAAAQVLRPGETTDVPVPFEMLDDVGRIIQRFTELVTIHWDDVAGDPWSTTLARAGFSTE